MAFHSAAEQVEGNSQANRSARVDPATRTHIRKVRALAVREESKEFPGIKDWFTTHDKEFCVTRPFWIARDGKDIVGYLIARVDETKDMKCNRFFVLPGYNDDVKSNLLKEFEEAAIKLGKDTAHIHVYPAKKDQIMPFLERHGYSLTPYKDKEIDPKVEGYLMVKHHLKQQGRLEPNEMLRHLWLDPKTTVPPMRA